MSITPTKQLNLLIIKNLFERWQEETESIKSPYFDYETPEIAEAMEKLMNLLSRNISVKRTYFEPLLIQATEDTLRLLLAPYLFYEQEFDNQGTRFHLEEDFKPLAKYIKTHTSLLEKITEALEKETDSEGFVDAVKARQCVEGVIRDNLDYDDPKPSLREFHQVKPLRLQDLVAKPGENLDKHKAPVPPVTKKPETVQDTRAPEPASDNHTETPAPPQPAPANTESSNPTPAAEAETPEKSVMDKVSDNEPQQQTVHERILDEEPAQPTVLERQQRHTGDSLESLIPLNRKMAFVEELFNGEQSVFEEVVDKVDHCANYHEAIMYIRERCFYKYDWDLGSSAVQEFYSIIENKFD